MTKYKSSIIINLSFLIGLAGCQKLPTEPAVSSKSLVRGITLVDWSVDGYGKPLAERAIESIAARGATHLAIIVSGYQTNRNSSEMRIDHRRTPSQSSVRQALNLAVSQGLKVVIKPHIELDDGGWFGDIKPSDPGAWFQSYNNFLLPWAALAESVGGVQFIIGTELAGTIQHGELWRETIRMVKSVFSGELVYAASWDEAFKVPFWRDLDYIGVDFYFPVTIRKDPGRFEILAGWQPWLERMQLLHNQTGLKILLTEIGYKSVDGAGMHPYKFDEQGALDLLEQADLYWAALQATADIPWLAGMYWWNWPADGSGGPNNTDYTPAGKPAELELMKGWNVQ